MIFFKYALFLISSTLSKDISTELHFLKNVLLKLLLLSSDLLV